MGIHKAMNIPERYRKAKWEDVPKAVRDAIESVPVAKRGVYLHGGIGSGKTHIAWAVAAHLAETRNHHAIVWNVSDLFKELRADFDRPLPEKVKPEADMEPENRRFVILDDIGAEKATDYVAETLYRIVNARYEAKKAMMFTSNLTVAELADRIGERTASRIVEMCEIIELTGGDRRLKMNL